MIRYVDGPADSGRWQDFPLRPDDIVISTPSKCGTTWLQMICALLIFQTGDLPAPLTTLSPWLDMRLRPLPEVRAVLAAQRHRRFIKTHTPLDGLPHADGVRYIVVGRDPRDVAISMAHHRDNLDAELIHRLLGAAPPGPPDQDIRSGVRRWVERPDGLASLAGMVRHLAGAWDRRAGPAIIMIHYGQLVRDLDGTMRQLANPAL